GQRFDASVAERLARLRIGSIQVSLEGDSQEVYECQRPGGSLAKAHAACRAARAAGLPLEVTFAPTKLNIHELPAVIERAASFGAFRFNTGKLMRIGTAARLWDKLEPTATAYRELRRVLDEQRPLVGHEMALCYIPFDMRDALRGSLDDPPATMLVLPNGWVKVAAALPYVCADLRRKTVAQAWEAYCKAWRNSAVAPAVRRQVLDKSSHAKANAWTMVPVAEA